VPALLEYARRIAASAIELETVEYGGDPLTSPNPWLGTMRSKSADQVSRNYAVGGSNFLYLPRSDSFKRRLGQTQRFDTFGSAVGMLPAQWTDAAAPLNAKCRWMEEFTSSSLASDGVPTVMALVTKEAVASGTDDGRFSNVWVRDQVGAINYTLGSEYSSTTYPAIGTEQTYKVVPLWYDSGDGGLSRGVDEFARRFLVSGSRRFLKVGNWTYFPSLLGTPSRWNGERAAGAVATFQASSDITSPLQCDLLGSAPEATAWQSIDDQNDATSFIRFNQDSSRIHYMGVAAGVPATSAGTAFTISYQARRLSSVTAGKIWLFAIWDSAGKRQYVNLDPANLTLSFANYTTTITFNGAESGSGSTNRIEIGTDDATGNVEISYVSVSTGSAGAVNRLIPSGPLPPLHAGTLDKGAVISDSGAVSIRPDADVTDGAWTDAVGGTTLFSQIDESTLDITDYVKSANNGAACTIGLGDPGFTPGVSDTVKIKFYNSSSATGTGNVLTVRLLEGASIRRSVVIGVGGPSGTSWGERSVILNASQIAAISDWTNLRLYFEHTGAAAQDERIAQAWVEITQDVVQTQGGWKGSDRFYYSMAYRFEDGSVWATCPPRPPSSLLTAGFNLFTVDVANPSTSYDRIIWSNIAIGPHGCVGRILLRTPKISAVQDDNLQLDPFDLRIIWEIKDNTTTTYDDYYGTDESLTLDVAKSFIRYDHLMPPRSRYIFGGDMRVCHSYGGQNPCAIEIAPVGRAADYDLNLADTSASAFASQASFMQIKLDTSGAGTLTLIQGDGATATDTTTLAFTTYTTLQKLVDKINSTSFAVEGQQWRAQLCPGANPDASTLSLTPHNRAIASCVIDNTAKTITKAAGGLSKVAIGQLISGAAEETSAYVTVITSDTSLTYSGTLTTGTETLYFYNGLGDSQITDPDTTATGFQRVIAGSLPGFLYFNESYLDDTPLEKQSIWMTVASPGASKSAANNFSGKTSNRFNALNANAGISMGGGPCDQGFVVPFANAAYVIRNIRDTGSGFDEDYRIQALNESRGCCAWNTVVPGNRFVPYLTSEGLVAANLDGEVLLSEAIFVHGPTAVGDFDYEIPLCVAATAADTDAAYASSRIMRGAILVNYRDSGTHPDRQVFYDFSSGKEQVGLTALFRDDGKTPWGWSTELSRSMTAMCEARTNASTDGRHLYGWNELNAGSVGDGRIDEFEVSETDNGTAIAGSILTPWEKGSEQRQVSGQEIVLEHVSPAGSTGSLTFYRSYSEDSYALTPSTGSTVVVRDVKMLPQAARAQSAACKVGYSQATGSAREVRKISLRLKRVRAYK